LSSLGVWRENPIMSVLELVTASAASGGMRILLLALVLIAVVLIITGAVIASVTWYQQRKAISAQ
jgi:cytochrome b subunit of formate dehydrogenase